MEQPEQRTAEAKYLAGVSKRGRERLHKFKAFRKLITICAWCRKIRHGEGVWRQPQTDLKTDNGVKATHGICPECADIIRNPTQPPA